MATRKADYSKSEYWPIEKLQLWNKNPRAIKEDRFKELTARLERQGQIKPLLVTADGTVIGGNMRLRAMQAMGIGEVWVSVTNAKTDKEMFDLALTDNEEFGYYDKDQLAELALSLELSPLELKSYELQLGKPTTLELVVDPPAPDDSEATLNEEYQVVVECADESEQQAVFEQLQGEGKTCKILTL
jgi:ParB-like chromosome segregation protein Spo0J